VARKLSVLLLHRLWVTAEVYDPLYNASAALLEVKLPEGSLCATSTDKLNR
jgi:hypothetical protein